MYVCVRVSVNTVIVPLFTEYKIRNTRSDKLKCWEENKNLLIYNGSKIQKESMVLFVDHIFHIITKPTHKFRKTSKQLK